MRPPALPVRPRFSRLLPLGEDGFLDGGIQIIKRGRARLDALILKPHHDERLFLQGVLSPPFLIGDRLAPAQECRPRK